MRRCDKCGQRVWLWDKSHAHFLDKIWFQSSVVRYERTLIWEAKAHGATDYVFVSLATVPGEGEEKGRNLAILVEKKWPSALHDPDLSTAERWAFLLPNNEVAGRTARSSQ